MKIKKIVLVILISLICLEKANTEISDSLFMTIGDKAIAQSDIVNEIKILLILNNESYSDEKREELHRISVQSIIKRKIKEIEIERTDFFEFNQQDVNYELKRLANNINVDLETLKNICESNELDFAIIEKNIQINLAWNSLIFELYKDKISIDSDEIDEQLRISQEKKTEEYLISEIMIKPVEKNMVESEIKKLKDKIKIEGFESVAKRLSISESALNGGDLGWLNENSISDKIKPEIVNTPVGELSKPILLPNGILLFQIRNKRKIDHNLSLEEKKDELVKFKKIKILKMHSLAHYDKVRRTITIQFLQ